MNDYNISQKEFELITGYIYREIGISLPITKKTLVKSRLTKRLVKLNLKNFMEYYHYLENEKTGEELLILTNEITTNVTSFFREASQWEYLETVIEKKIKNKDKKLRIWSSASSSGQEPYTIIMFLMNNIKDIKNWDIKILATDISEEILTKAIEGEYDLKDIQGIPKKMILEYFNENKITNKYIIKEKLKKYITFRKFNLVSGDYNILKDNTFDWIFCRNVMIYFDKTSKEKVVLNLIDKIKKDGLFFLGHSENLVSIPGVRLKVEKPSIFRK